MDYGLSGQVTPRVDVHELSVTRDNNQDSEKILSLGLSRRSRNKSRHQSRAEPEEPEPEPEPEPEEATRKHSTKWPLVDTAARPNGRAKRNIRVQI